MLRQIFATVVVALLTGACAPEPAAPTPRPGADILLPVETEIIEALVPRHATLESLLEQHELPADLILAAIESARAVFNPRQLRAERPYRMVLSLDKVLREFEYQIDADRFLRIVNRDRSTPLDLRGAGSARHLACGDLWRPDRLPERSPARRFVRAGFRDVEV